jgi:Na+/proline symporter
MGAVVCIYVYLGGFNSVLATDLIQAIVMFAVISLLVLAYKEAPASVNTTQSHVLPPLGEMGVLMFGGFFAVLGGADVWQRVLSARNDACAKKGLFINSGGWLIFGILIVALAIKVQTNHPTADPNTAFFLILETGLPAWLSAMATLLLFSALISTADTEMFVLSVMANKELNRMRNRIDISTKITRVYVVILTIIACILALFLRELVDIYFVLLYLMMILGPVALARLLGRGTPVLAIVGICGGVLTLIILTALGRLSGSYPLLVFCPPLVTFLVRGKGPLTEETGDTHE